MDEIRLLGKEDIDVRVAQTNTYNNNGQTVVKVSLLLYKNARVDMKILDELFTPMGWKRTHRLIGDRLYCQVEVWDAEKKEWICKEDVGVESNTEAEKGQASDSFKRACVNWGIIVKDILNLVCNDIEMLPCLSLVKVLANAEDNAKAACKSQLNFLDKFLVGLAIVLTPLRMSKYSPLAAY